MDHKATKKFLLDLAAANPALLSTGSSHLEGNHGLAVLLHPTAGAEYTNHAHPSSSMLPNPGRDEICHVHDLDGSLHAQVSAVAAKVILDRGWGKRHPVSEIRVPEMALGAGFVLLFAPRNREEVDVLAVW